MCASLEYRTFNICILSLLQVQFWLYISKDIHYNIGGTLLPQDFQHNLYQKKKQNTEWIL